MRILAVLIGFSISVYAKGQQSPTGFDLVIEAVRWQGLNPTLITCGYAEIEMAAKEMPPSKEAIQREADGIANGLKKAYASVTDPRLKASVERAVQDMPNTLTRLKTERRSRIKILFDGNDFSGRRKFFASNYNPATKTWSKPYEGLRREANKSGGEDVLWNPSAKLATINNRDLGLPEFHEFGRICGPAAKLLTLALLKGSDPSAFQFSQQNIETVKAQFLEISKQANVKLYARNGEVKYDNGAVAYVVESHHNGHVMQRYWIDASRGYICPLIQYIDQSGRISAEWKSSNYFLHAQSGLWFPAKHTYTRYQDGTNEIAEQADYTIDKNKLQLNQPVALADFSIELPANTRVWDTRSGRDEQYRTNETVKLSFVDGGLDLQSKAFVPVSHTNSPASSGAFGRRSSWFLIANVIIILLILCVLAVKYRRARWVTLLIALTFLPSTFGCSSSPVETGLAEARTSASSSSCGCGMSAPENDVWHNGSISIRNSSPEATFEIHTTKYPDVRFDLTHLARGVRIEEVKRRAEGDETVIEFRLSLDSVRPDAVTLFAIENEIKTLTIPISYLRPPREVVRKDLWPNRISLGVISSKKAESFDLYGDGPVLESLKIASHSGLPYGMTLEVGPIERGKRAISIHWLSDAEQGFFDGEVKLQAANGHEIPVHLSGLVR